MQDSNHRNGIITAAADYDAVIVGASLAGCTTAILLGRAGARVALVEKQPDPKAFKRICTHFIQSSGGADARAARPARADRWRPAARARTSARGRSGAGSSRRRSRSVASRQPAPRAARPAACARWPPRRPASTCCSGRPRSELLRDADGAVAGVVVRDHDGRRDAPARAADDRRRRARLARRRAGRRAGEDDAARALRLRRLLRGAAARTRAPDATIWMLDPQWAAAFPTDDGLDLLRRDGDQGPRCPSSSATRRRRS